ncbi:flavodoxin family protein [Desulfogranum japonicum]|uniref:flavodoxin family protein n=1 Tax=Desulfogranum japonicum TaxID=231447 RepID=UPI000418FA68|nr:flavodoxin family protein [Desulfogranum japonicum]
MKVLILEGGARKQGNTATVCGWVVEELETLGHQVERISLFDKQIRGCLACGKCKQVTDQVACVQQDDANVILEKMVNAQVVLFTSPLYFWGITGPLKTFIDRTYSLYVQYHQPDHSSLVEGQRQGLLMTGGGPYENNVESAFIAFDRLQKPHKAISAGKWFVGSCSTPDKLPADIFHQAKEFARKLVG